MGLCNITTQEAFVIFMEINTSSKPTPSTVYWDALQSERDGHITIGEMDAISIFHKAQMVTLYQEHLDWEETDARLQAEVHEAQADYWDDHEAGLLSSAHYA